MFHSHFIASKPSVKNAFYLYTIKQGSKGSLQDYLTRFNRACLKIPNLNEGVTIEAIKTGIPIDGPFFNSISKIENPTLELICKIAQKYI